MTVSGPIPADRLGFTLPHEHLFLDTYSWPGGKSGSGALGIIDPVLDWDTVVDEVEAYRRAGGAAIVDLSLPAIGRAPDALRRVAETTGVHVVMGCGWYRDSFYPSDLNYRSTEELADELVREFEDGVGGSGVRPGVIGEIGVETTFPTAREERVLRAAARAHHRTGLAITTHTPIRTSGRAALEILLQEGVPPERVIIGHADSYPVPDYLTSLLADGCYVQFDCVAWSYKSKADMPFGPQELADLTVDLVRRGFGDRLLLSHDVSNRALLKRYGGDGFTCIAERFLPLLRDAGLEDEAIGALTVDNPRRALAVDL
jgi:phosphotriesterase-related protein